MNWFIIAIIAPFLFSISNYIDKYLVSKYFKNSGPGALVIFSSLIGLFLLPIIYLFQPSVINIGLGFAVLMIFNGFLYIITLIPYLYALQRGDASTVVPLYQLIPAFTYGLGLIFLKESLTILQVTASLLIIIGAMGISFEYSLGKFKINKKSLLLMVLSCFLIALNLIIFKFVAIRESFWTTSFWEYIGFSICALFLLIFIGSYRKQFISLFKNNKFKILSINAINEIINIIGKIIINFVSLLIPVTLVSVVGGIQPFFVLTLGVLLTLFFPDIIKEKIGKKYLFQKVFAIILMFAGVYLLST
jgi:drug/metabolite transporter (DMT)-like permease